MRVLMLSKALIIGAYQKKTEELARMPEVDLTVVVPPYWKEGRHRIDLERVFLDGYRLVVEPMAFNGNFHLHFYPGLGRLIRELRPDVFHVDEEPYNLATFLAIRLARQYGARALFFTWQNLHRRLPLPFNLFERYNYANADWAIAGSQGARDVLLRKGFPRPISVIPQFGVDPTLYSPDTPRAPSVPQPSSFNIGYVGRMVSAKGPTLLLDAVSGLPGDWHLTLIGEGPLKDELRGRAANLGMAERVTFLPYVRSEEVPMHLRALDALVLPSLTTPSWKEQFGRVLVEAMACGVPVVGSDSGEIPNVIGDAGLVFPEGSVDHLRQALGRIMSDPGLRASMARQGRQRVLACFTQAKVAQQTYEVYTRMLAQGNSAGQEGGA